MPTSKRQRRLSAPPEQVWEVVRDPHHMPRWWPGVTRMEGIQGQHFTQVFLTRKGRPVRIDHTMTECQPPQAGQPGQITWAQEIEGTPFERVLTESVIQIHLLPEGEETLVTIVQTQRLRGYSRTGGFMLRRATRRRLIEALDALADVV